MSRFGSQVVGPDHRVRYFSFTGPVMARRGPTHRMGKPVETSTFFECHRCGWRDFYWDIERGRQALLRHLWEHDDPPAPQSNDVMPAPGR